MLIFTFYLAGETDMGGKIWIILKGVEASGGLI